MLRRVQYSGITADNLQLLAAGATFTTTINTAAVHDLTTGTYKVSAEGAMPYAIGESSELSGSAVAFKSNTLPILVDGAAAAVVGKAIPAMTVTEREFSCSPSTSSVWGDSKEFYS